MEIIVLIAAFALVTVAATAGIHHMGRASFSRNHLTVSKIQARLAAQAKRAHVPAGSW